MRRLASFIKYNSYVINTNTQAIITTVQGRPAAVFISFLFLVINRNKFINADS